MATLDYGSNAARQNPEQVQHKEEGYGLVQHPLLDAHSPQLSPRTSLRRGSSLTDTASSGFAPASAWTGFTSNHHSHTADHVPAGDISIRSREHTLPGLPTAHGGTYPHLSGGSWSTTGPPESFAPSTGTEQLLEFNESSTSPFATTGLHVATGPVFDSVNFSPTGALQHGSGFPASPQSCKEGWISASSSDGLDFRNVPQLVQSQSPNFAASTHLLRRDGIRKKNARFEIPAERNLRTIDQLINQTSDEQELKELKQQKRLLRNRQAALDSRQRKKQHTERLEEEKKHYTAVISDLEDALSDYRVQETEWAREKDTWVTSQHQYQSYINDLILEKEEMLRRHTIESGELRRRNAVLMEQLNNLDSTAMSHVPSSSGYSADFSDFEHMPVNSWDDYTVPSEFSIEAERPIRREVAITPKPTLREQSSHEDKAVASGFLLMLLLCGAWVASRDSNASPSVIPSIPDDMRLASANVLDSLYKGSGIKLDGVAESKTGSMANHIDANLPQSKTTLSACEIASLSQPTLEPLHQRLTAPSPHQLEQQAFSLTPTQYNDLMSGHGYSPNQLVYGQSTRNVGDVLGAPQEFRETTVADTYAKSLLKDKVSTQVLKDFARMVTESRKERQTPWKSEQLG